MSRWFSDPRGALWALNALAWTRRVDRMLRAGTMAEARQSISNASWRLNGASVDQTVTACSRAFRLTPEGWCLRRSLVLHQLLTAAGASPTLRTGARIDAEGKPAIHAWVELDGRPLLQDGRSAALFKLLDLE